MEQSKIDRINQLARKARTPEGLTAESVERTIGSLGVLGDTRVVVTDPAGAVLYDWYDGVRRDTSGQYALFWEVAQALRGNDVFRSEYRDGAFRSRAAVPITYRSMTLGAVYLYEYDGEQGALLSGVQQNLRSISVAICVGSLILSVIFSRALTRRIADLLKAIRTVRQGAYSHRDELTQLAGEFNALTGRLQTTEEVRRRFVSDASHELKTPLSSIRLLTDSILQSDSMDGETAREFLTDIGEEAERLTRITEKLLRLTRMDTAPPQRREPVDLRRVVEKVLHMLTPLARAVEVGVRTHLASDAWVEATEDDLYQVAFNLMENAVKYNLPGGTVDVTLEDGPLGQNGLPQVLLRVEDTGVGIPQEDLPRIFERFYRVDKARSRAAGGTGLGLSIVQDTVRQHGGTVTVRRRTPEGTCFEVLFPRCERGGDWA